MEPSRHHLLVVRAARAAGLAGVAGGLGWATLVVLSFAVARGVTPLGYGVLDAFTPVALALVLAGVAGHGVRTRGAWGRLAGVGFVVLAAGLVGALGGSLFYVVGGLLTGWTVSVWGYFLALLGATVFGAGLLLAGVPPLLGAVLLAASLPVGLAVSFSLAVGGIVPDEAVVPVGPGVLLGVGIAVLGWWLTTNSNTASERT